MNGLWCVTFVEYWKRQEIDLGVRWGVKGVAGIQQKRREFQHEKEVRDPVTGETIQVFPATKRLSRQLLQVPFALLAVLALGTLIATCFGIEIFLSEVYNGPGQTLLVCVCRVPSHQTLILGEGLSTYGNPNDSCADSDVGADVHCYQTE